MEKAYFLGQRLRNLYDLIIKDVKHYYKLQESDFEPRWFPLIVLLRDRTSMSVTEIARELGQSHVAIVQLSAILEKKGLIDTKKDLNDIRRRLIWLSPKGKETVEKLTPVWEQIIQATKVLLDENAPEFLTQLSMLEQALHAESLLERIEKLSGNKGFSIIAFEDQYREDFVRINMQWLMKYFGNTEPGDVEMLTNPQKILDQEGEIYLSCSNGMISGTFCLINHNNSVLELAKLAVHEDYRRKGIGSALVEKAISRARERKAEKLILFTSPMLVVANNLYHRKGFIQVENDQPEHYKRETIKMEMEIT
jgi:DNA-binding MarR family transcriptional regulator/N-acetylglutamate synthase-like GNAT family acetyltransferase